MKAIIPVAGIGKRLRPITNKIPKTLLPIAGKPIIEYILDSLKQTSVTDVILVIGHLKEMIEDFVKDRKDFNYHLVVQDEIAGIAHAVMKTEKLFNEDEPVLIVLGDTIFIVDFNKFTKSNDIALGVKTVEAPSLFGIVKLDKTGTYIKDLKEKPMQYIGNLAIAGIYFFPVAKDLFISINSLISKGEKTLGEYQLTDALRIMVSNGFKMRAVEIDDWFDCGDIYRSLQANRNLLNSMYGSRSVNYSFPDSIIIPPVWFGEDLNISNSIVGPYVSIGNNSVIENSIIKDSIFIGNNTVRKSLIHSSILGYKVEIVGEFKSLTEV